MSEKDWYKKYYEAYWESKTDISNFFEYERNKMIPKFFKDREKTLDLASGDSAVGEFLIKEYGSEVWALDISKRAIQIANKRGVKGIVGSVDSILPFEDNFFDSVFWGDNIEHLLDPLFTLTEIKRVLRPKGKLILTTPNISYWRYRTNYFLTGNMSRSEGSPNPPWSWEHIRFFNFNILRDFLKQEGFSNFELRGISKRKFEIRLSQSYPNLFATIIGVKATLRK